jgi:hypothetical protein
MPSKEDAIAFHRQIVKQALEVAWKHKHLWIFGFFATFAGFGNVYEALFTLQDRIAASAGGQWLTYLPGWATFKALITYSPAPWLSAIIYGVVSLLIAAVFAWVVVMALSGTIAGVKAVSKGKELSFSENLKQASVYFWRVLAVVLIMKAVTMLASLVVSTNLTQVLAAGGPVWGLNFFVSFALFTAVTVVVGLIGVYAITAVVDDSHSLTEALCRGWKTFKKHWLVSLEAALLVLAVHVVVMLLGILALLIISVPFIFLLMLAILANLPMLGLVLAIAAAVATIFVVALLAAFLSVYQVSVWWQLWQHFKGRKKLLPGLERWLGKLFR